MSGKIELYNNKRKKQITKSTVLNVVLYAAETWILTEATNNIWNVDVAEDTENQLDMAVKLGGARSILKTIWCRK